jgi:glycosyltransferase involved in cell wall biosynthesis
MTYVLVTAARNEAQFIGATLDSVVSQTVRPSAWVVVSDGSTDATDDIVSSYAARYPFITLMRVARADDRNFGAKVNAVRLGFAKAKTTSFDLIGNLDADVSFEPTYFERLLERFRQEPRLGIAGGWIHEETRGRFRPRRFNRAESVPHAVQLLRRQCYEDIGHYLPLKYGGEDTHAVVCARMHGWLATAFDDLPVLHHRRTSSAGGLLSGCFRRGLADHALGYLLTYAIGAYVRRLRERPYIAGSLLRFLGYTCASLRGDRRIVSDEFVAFLRTEQRRRLRLLQRRLPDPQVVIIPDIPQAPPPSNHVSQSGDSAS